MIPPILCYHKVDPRLELGFTRLGPAAFKRQMEAMAKAGWHTMGSADLLAQAVVANVPGVKTTLPPRYRSPGAKHFVLTFDDGYEALKHHAFPILKELGFRALVFVITDFVGRENSWDVQYGWRRFQHLSWDDLERWRKRGIEVHSHTVSHARLTWLPDDAVREELFRSRETIVQRLGNAAIGISYPFGAADARIQRLAKEAGYQLGFAGPNHAEGEGPMMLPRRPVYAWDASGIPKVLRDSPLGAVSRGVARMTNRFAVGTALFQKVMRRRY